MKYPKFSNIDLKESMQTIVDLNTLHYETDVLYDFQLLDLESQDLTKEQNFFWLSRTCGTNMFNERDVFMTDTASYNTFQHWSTQDTALLYFIEVESVDNGLIIGDMTEIDRTKTRDFVKENAQKPFQVLINSTAFEEPCPFPYDSYMQQREEFDYVYGPYTLEYVVENEPLLELKRDEIKNNFLTIPFIQSDNKIKVS